MTLNPNIKELFGNHFDTPGTLEDYVFLSAPDTDKIFLVERSGTVWEQPLETSWSVKHREKNEIFNCYKYIKGKAKWSWLDGYLPVLHIENEDTAINLFVFGDELFIDLEESALIYPGKRQIEKKEIENKINSIRKYWHKRFLKLNFSCDNQWFHNALKACFVISECTYYNLHPHYGVGYYGMSMHDGFPPTTIRMVENCLIWGEVERAGKYLEYFLDNFIIPETGNINYYGPSLAEYGMLLELIANFNFYPDGQKWLKDNIIKSARIAEYVLNISDTDKYSGLYRGVPEADEVKDVGVYIHNNAYLATGLIKWGKMADEYTIGKISQQAIADGYNLKTLTRKAIDNFKQNYGFIPYRLDKATIQPKLYYESRHAGYANYRYYPELLESGILTQEETNEIVTSRLKHGGEEFGMTIFPNKPVDGKKYHYDDWTLVSYLKAMLHYKMPEAFTRSFLGHLLYHMSRDTFIAYEQVHRGNLIREAYADYCIPSQLTLPMIYKLAMNSSIDMNQIINKYL